MFRALKARNEKAFMAYITAGDPTLDATVEYVQMLEECGVDLIELGVPFSDPLADGIVNQESAERALKAGATLEGVLKTLRRIRQHSDIPIIFYSYLNTFYASGFEDNIRKAREAGLDGLLLLDLPIEEDPFYMRAIRKAGLDSIWLITPTSTEQRIKKITRHASGFLYCVSRTGVTGKQSAMADETGAMVSLVKRHTDKPLALGFGISSPETAARAASLSDAIVVGSAIVQRLHDAHNGRSSMDDVKNWVLEMVKACKEVKSV